MRSVPKSLQRLLTRPRRSQPGQARIHRDPFFDDPAVVEDDYWRLSRTTYDR